MGSRVNKSKHLFVVDDDAEIRDLLKRYLEQQQFTVSTAASGESFLQAFSENSAVDLVILDIMLPGEDGFSVCRTLRGQSSVPVIMLTANSDEMDRIVGLELGADDYLAKPFNPRELLARIKAILRRTETQAAINTGHKTGVEQSVTQRYLSFSGFALDTLCRELTYTDGTVTALSGADFNLLMLFLNHPGQVLSRDRIADITRGRDSNPLDRFIDVHISRLRQRLNEDARHPQLIKTIRGEGYILTVPVEAKSEHSANPTQY